MIFEGNRATLEKTPLERASPFLQVIALFGIPAAGWESLVFLLQIPRLIYGEANPFLLVAEIGSLLTMAVLVFLLRACLALPSAPSGFYRNVLDFLALADWHPSVKVALAGLVVLPQWWLLRSDHYSLITMWLFLGRRVLSSGDFHDALDRVAIVYQFALTGGVPLLFVLHLLSRKKKARGVLLWLLVPVLFVGAAIGVVILVTLLHKPS